MVLQSRPIAFTLAVIGFFGLSIIGALVGLSTGTCCERALVGTAVIYATVSVAVRAISTILTQAMIAGQVNKDTAGDNEN